MSYTPRLRKKYFDEVVPAMQAKFNYKSSMQVPRISKIVLNQGIGAAVNDKKLVDAAVEEMTKITGQKAVPTMSKKAISNFKLREIKTVYFENKSYSCIQINLDTSPGW